MIKKTDTEQQLDLGLGGAPATPAAPTATARPAALTSLSATKITGPLKNLVDVNFLQYASYVIKDRAIPDLADGLKPVQRRILWSLHEKDDGKFIKVANITGYCMQFHPHGDASISDALVGLTNKQYLIEGQGNFGNVLTGDSAAAARYIECRLTDLARKELFNDALTEFVPSYDGRNKEPVTLPCKLPLLLMLGADGIAVGLATRILPHNFPELLEAQIAILQKKPFKVLPDFPQGGLMDVSEYDKGRGKVRARAVIEERDEKTLVIREIPYGTTTESLIASVEDAARKKKLNIRSIQDYTAGQVEIVIALQQDETAHNARQTLYAFTQCEVPLSSNIVVIHERRPVEMDVHEILHHTTQQLVVLLRRELELEKKQLLDQLHWKTLVQLFVEHRIYKRIEQCTTNDAVRKAIKDGVNEHRAQLRRDLVEADIDMLLDVRIKRISLFDIRQNQKEMDDIVVTLAEVEKNLGQLVPYAIRYLKNLHKTYLPLFPRKTKVSRFEEVEVRALTSTELSMKRDLAGGYFGFGVDGDQVFQCSSLDKVLLVWNDGRYQMLPPPEKMFVDRNLIYAAIYDRDRIMTMVYRSHGIAYLKRFTFGGAIMNKDYQCAPPGSRVLLFSDEDPELIHAVYEPAKGQRIHQQVFGPRETPVKGARTLGVQMTVKDIKNVSVNKPRNWDDNAESPRGTTVKA